MEQRLLLSSPFHIWGLLGLENLSMVPKITLWNGRERSQLQVTASRAQWRNDISVGPERVLTAGDEVSAGWGCRGAQPKITVAWECCRAVPTQGSPLDAPSPSCTVTFPWHKSMALGLFPQPVSTHCSEPHSPLAPALPPGVSAPSWA